MIRVCIFVLWKAGMWKWKRKVPSPRSFRLCGSHRLARHTLCLSLWTTHTLSAHFSELSCVRCLFEKLPFHTLEKVSPLCVDIFVCVSVCVKLRSEQGRFVHKGDLGRRTAKRDNEIFFFCPILPLDRLICLWMSLSNQTKVVLQMAPPLFGAVLGQNKNRSRPLSC